MSRLLSAVLLAGVAACGAPGQPAGPAPSPSTTSSSPSPTPSPSTSAAPVVPTLASLAEQPCQALGHEDTVRLNVFVEGSEVPDPSGKSCQWGARGALVTFTSYPGSDKTREPDVQRLTVSEIEGHRAVLGTHSRGRHTSYTILVSTGPGQSFRIMTTNFGSGTPGPDALTVGKNAASAVIHRLRQSTPR